MLAKLHKGETVLPEEVFKRHYFVEWVGNNESHDAISYALSNTDWSLELSPDSIPKITIHDEYFMKENGEMNQIPTKQEYEKALEVVQKYEDRQKDLEKLNRDLGYALKKFDKFRFDINESKKEVTFTGVMKDGQLKLTKSVARNGDKFETVIGKLIAVKMALGEDIEYIDKFVVKSYPNNKVNIGQFATFHKHNGR